MQSNILEVTNLDFSIELYELAKKMIAQSIEVGTIEQFEHLEDLLEVLILKYSSTYKLIDE